MSTVTVVKPRRAGRPSAAKGTVRILPGGAMRLSPDLCTAKTFSVALDWRAKTLTVTPQGEFKLYFSRATAKSGLLSLRVVFSLLGADLKAIAGEYKVQKLKSGGFVVKV